MTNPTNAAPERDGTERLCQLLYGRGAQPKDYLGGANAKMLHDAADALLRRADLAPKLTLHATTVDQLRARIELADAQFKSFEMRGQAVFAAYARIEAKDCRAILRACGESEG